MRSLRESVSYATRLDEVLEEAVLTALRRQRVGLDREISLRTSDARIGSSSASSRPVSADEAPQRERLAEHGRRPGRAGAPPAPRPSSRAAMSACSVSGHLERLDLARRPVGVALADEQRRGRAASAPSRPRRSGTPSARSRIRARSSSGRPGTRPGRAARSIASADERLEEERGEVALARAPGRAALAQLGPREREDEER